MTDSAALRGSLPGMRHSYVMRIFLFLLVTFAGLLVAMVAMAFILKGGFTTLSLRLGTVAQDLLLFIFPAVAVAVMVSADGARLLCADRLPGRLEWCVALVALMCSMPAMNAVVSWNESLSLPSALAPVEAWMRQAEEAAQGQVRLLLGGTSVADLIVSILIVGVLAGVSEELFFRGAMQRILSSGPLGPHAAIWITAVLFSVFHMQFFGFFPRMLLGAFFGYLLYWSGSVWLPAIVHAFNNGMVVYASWRMRVKAPGEVTDINSWGADSWWLILLSVVLTAIVIYVLKNTINSRNSVTR